VPLAPTATAGTSTQQLATTAFVAAATAPLAPLANPTFTGIVTIPAGAAIAGYAPLASPIFTGTPKAPTPAPTDASTNIATTAFVRQGVTNASNAAAGQIGELVVNSATVPLTTTVTANICTITLSAGDWDVFGQCDFSPSAYNISLAACAPTLTSATLAYPYAQINSNSTLSGWGTTSGPLRVNTASTVTVYLAAQAIFPSGTCNVTGYLSARRMR
jgi:hypothetical protein